MEKLAIIELSDISLKLVVLKVNEGHFKVIDEISENCKIASEIAKDGLIKPKNISDAITALKLFRKLSENYGVTRTVSVAYNFLLSAKNQKSFLEEVYNNTGVNFNVLSPEDEIKAIYTGVINCIDISKGFIININNNDSELIKFNRRCVVSSYTIPYGAVNLAEEYSECPAEKMVSAIKEEIEKLNISETIEPESSFIICGPSNVALGRLAKKIAHYSLDLENNYIITNDIFEKTFSFVSGLDLDKTKKLKGISEDRADSLLSGLCIMKAFMDKLNIIEATVTTAGVKEGLIYSNIQIDYNDKFNDMLGHSLENIREFDSFDSANNAHVYGLAIILFKQLKVMHKLPRFYVKPLRIAASMYDCGKCINYDNYEKHGFYKILNAGITGASQKEILLAAFICSCQNLGNFNLSEWVRYKDILTDEDLDAVRKLSIIVKLASALDSSRKSIVEDISCDILGDSVIMKTIVKGDPTFEIMQGMKLASDYKKVFKKFLQII